MKRIFISFILLAIYSPAFALDTKTIHQEVAFQILNIADYAITEELLDDGYTEGNVLIGSNPSDGELAAWCVGTGAVHYLMTKYVISDKYMDMWQYSTIILKVGAVGWNLHFKF